MAVHTRDLWPVLLVLYSPAAGAQAGGVTSSATRALNTLNQSGPGPQQNLSFEVADDPTLGGVAVPYHQPLSAARKAAQKAEHLAKKGQHEEAITSFREALSIDPKYYEAGNNLALEMEAAGQHEEAEKTFRSLMQSSPEHLLAFTNLGTLLLQQHRYADAEAVARQAMKQHRFSFKTNFLLGSSLVDQGHWTGEAKDTLEYAQVRYPEAKKLLEKWPAK